MKAASPSSVAPMLIAHGFSDPIRLRLPMTTPPMTSPCPLAYFVKLCKIKSISYAP